MPLDRATIISLLQQALPDAQIELRALVDDGDHYAATIESRAFVGLSRVRQHQLVYRALEGKLGNELHALALETRIPKESSA